MFEDLDLKIDKAVTIEVTAGATVLCATKIVRVCETSGTNAHLCC